MTAKEVQKTLVGYRVTHLWSPLAVTAALNTNGVVGWECDLLVVHKSGWAWEVEIKVSVADFRRELKEKALKHKALVEGKCLRKVFGKIVEYGPSYIRQFYFAMPADVLEKVYDEIPEWAGIIRVENNRARIERKGKNLPATKCDDDMRRKMKDSVYYRFWKGQEVA